MIFTLDQLVIYGLVVARILGVIALAPFFSNRQLFSMGKVALILWMAGLILFVIPLPETLPDSQIAYLGALLVEFLVGALIGFTLDILISAIEFAGGLMDTQAGLSVASLLDPSTGRNASLFEQFLKYIAIMVFLQVDGHHAVLSTVYSSFTLLPIGVPVNIAEGARFVLGHGKDIFAFAVQLAAPILLVVFLVDFAFGMLNRVAEQINVFQLGFQLKPTVSLIIFLAITPGLTSAIVSILEIVLEKVVVLMTQLQQV